jgi:predicted RNA-binding Zn ribbon-like protein
VRKLAQQSLKRLQDNAIHAIKQKAASGTRSSSPYEVAKKAIKDIWRSTFGQAGEGAYRRDPAYAYEYAHLPRQRPFNPADYLRNHPSSRRYLSTGRANSSKTPIGNHPWVATRLRPSINSGIRGPSAVTNLGIGSSRNFSSHGAGKVFSEINRNVPVGMRALADKLRDLDDDARKKKSGAGAFRAQAGKAGRVGKALKRHEKSMGIKGSRWSAAASRMIAQARRQKTSEEFNQYFPSVKAPVTQDANVPEVDQTTDANMTTYLLVPLCPSLAHLVSGTSSASLQDDVPETPNLLRQVLPMHLAFDRHVRLRVTPLLLRLQGHGALDLSPELWLTDEYRTQDGRVEVIFAPGEDGESRPDALRITFEGRTVDQVRAMAGARTYEEEWFHLYSVPSLGKVSSDVAKPFETSLQMPSVDRSGALSSNVLFDAEYPDHGIWAHESPSLDSSRPEISSLWLQDVQEVWEGGSESSSPPWSDSEVEMDLLSGSEFSEEEAVW